MSATTLVVEDDATVAEGTRMAEHIAAIDARAAGIQHEINNPLAAVIANVQFALDVLRARPSGCTSEDVAELLVALKDASEGAERVRHSVEEIRHVTRAAEVDPAATPPPARTARRARVLVVDDELFIGKAIRRILADEHDVTLETDARHALELLAHETYDIVFCDLMMPNMNGMDFFDAISARRPELAARVVFLTGGAFSPRSAEFLRTSQNVCLSKPFSREAVCSAVRKMIETPPT